MKVNYKSDFELTIQLTAGGVDIAAPSWDWQLRFYTFDRQAVYTVAHIDGKAERCAVNTDGTITAYFDKHGLMPGVLRCEFVNLVPDSHYTHDTQMQVDPVELGVELWRGASDGGMDAVTLELAGQVLAEVQALAADLQQKAESGYFDGEPGPQGPQGPPGPAGPGLLVVTVTGSDQEALTADHTAAEILAAHEAGRPVVAVYDGEVYQLASVGASLASFSLASAGLEVLAQIDVDGDGGVHLGDVVLVNDLTTGGEGNALSAEMGKLIGGVLYGTNENLFDKDDPTNGQMQFYGRVLSHKIYTSSRTIYTKGSRALLVYDSNDTQLSYTLKESNTAGAMDKYTIADNLDFAYIRVGYTASTVVVDNDLLLHQFYYGNSVSSLFAFASPTMFNVVNPNTETFGTQTMFGYVASDMMLVKGVNVVTVKGVNFYQLYDDGLNAVASRVNLIAGTSYRVETNGAAWIRLGASSLDVLRGAVLVLCDLSLNVSAPSEANFIEYVLRHINKTSSYNGTKIAVSGDSIAHGYNDETAMGGWSARVAKALGAELVSYTYPGASVCKRTALPEMSQYSLVERSKQIAESSDEYSAILLAYGTNDAGNATPISPLADVVDASEDEYNFTSALFYSLKRIVDAKPNANVFVVNLLARDGNSPDDANAYNEMLTEVANHLAIPVLDVRRNSGINPNVPSMKTAFMPDGLHPNAAGYERIARCIVQDGLINCYNAVSSSQTELTDNEIDTICV